MKRGSEATDGQPSAKKTRGNEIMPTQSGNDDPRTGSLFQTYTEDVGSFDTPSVVVIPFPFSEGCVRNGGRGGAELGPEVALRYMKKIGTVVNPEHNVDISSVSLYVCGAEQYPAGLTLEGAHTILERLVASVLKKGGIPFVIGGGNDQSYTNASALLSERGSNVSVINIDAHLDVRPLKNGKIHSGSPFRLLLNDERFDGQHFVEFAAQGSQCSASHAAFVKEHGGAICWLSELPAPPASFTAILENAQEHVFVSFDLDSVSSEFAPGVSCPGTVGLSARDALSMCQLAGQCTKVALFDLSEFSPVIEEDRTGRLVAQMFYHFILGVAARAAAA